MHKEFYQSIKQTLHCNKNKQGIYKDRKEITSHKQFKKSISLPVHTKNEKNLKNISILKDVDNRKILYAVVRVIVQSLFQVSQC